MKATNRTTGITGGLNRLGTECRSAPTNDGKFTDNLAQGDISGDGVTDGVRNGDGNVESFIA